MKPQINYSPKALEVVSRLSKIKKSVEDFAEKWVQHYLSKGYNLSEINVDTHTEFEKAWGNIKIITVVGNQHTSASDTVSYSPSYNRDLSKEYNIIQQELKQIIKES